MDAPDRYAAARATLRENVKWMATGFAGMTAVILAGTPFTGFGKLEIPSIRFFGAVGGLLLATGCAFRAWQMLLDMVRPDATYTGLLDTGNPGFNMLSQAEQTEYTALQNEFQSHKQELLPTQIDSIAQLEELEARAWQVYQNQPGDPAAKDRWSEYRTNHLRVDDWASYTRLHQRITRETVTVRRWGIALLVGLALFAWCANPGERKTSDPARAIIIVSGVGDGCSKATTTD